MKSIHKYSLCSGLDFPKWGSCLNSLRDLQNLFYSPGLSLQFTTLQNVAQMFLRKLSPWRISHGSHSGAQIQAQQSLKKARAHAHLLPTTPVHLAEWEINQHVSSQASECHAFYVSLFCLMQPQQKPSASQQKPVHVLW